MITIKMREYALGVIMLVAAVAYLWATSQVPRKQFIDAAFVPYVLGISMAVLGVLQLWAAKKLTAEETATEDNAPSVDYLTVLKTVILIVGYAALLETVGFPLLTIVYLFVQFIVLTPANKKINLVSYALIAVVTSVSIYILFRYAFDLMLPLGWLDFDV